MKRSDLYTIGEVCRICNVNPSMMRYYDEIGLIKPYTVDEETGYRYYSGEVLLELPVLYYLKNLGFSLKEIKKALERENLDYLESLFCNKTEELEKTIREATFKKNSIVSWVELILEAKEVFSRPVCEISLEYFPETEMYTLRPSDFHGRTFLNLLINTSISKEIPSSDMYSLGALYLYYPDGNRENWDDIRLYIKNQQTENLEKIGGFSAVTCYHRGSFDAISETVEQMKKWAKAHDFTLRGDLMERSVIDCWSVKNPEWWLMEIYLPVIKQSF